ncbi:MAG: IS66 family transposase zinc-finger binding domain-containing protein, partial [Dysosmobacter sp.]|nr:IS66 family transposase zinc-finger binding domain-containing protein [Dysosmobacter sp.]
MVVEITELFWYNMSMNTEIKSHAEWQALLDKKEDEITALHRQVEWLTQQLRLTRGQNKRRKQAGKREMDFSGLPVEQVIHELPETECVCPECGGPLHKCGQSVLRRELVYVPAKYTVVEHIQAVYSCRCCERG